MEYISGPTLRSTIPSEGLRGNEKAIRKWIRELFLPVLDGVEIIHKGKDGAILHLIPQGTLTHPKSFGLKAGTFDVPAFYMDETEVTNRQYVDF